MELRRGSHSRAWDYLVTKTHPKRKVHVSSSPPISQASRDHRDPETLARSRTYPSRFLSIGTRVFRRLAEQIWLSRRGRDGSNQDGGRDVECFGSHHAIYDSIEVDDLTKPEAIPCRVWQRWW